MALRLRIFALLAIILPLYAGMAQKAHVQFINNSPDPQLAKLDIYLDNNKYVDDLAYHTATGTLDIDPGSPTFVVRDSTSSPSGQIHARWSPTLEANKRYVAIIEGVVNPVKFGNSNPDGIELTLDFVEVPDPRITANDPNMVDLIFSHGGPEYPRTDLIVWGQGTLVDNIKFKQVTQYYSLLPDRLLVTLRHGDEENERFGNYDADLRTHAGEAMVVVWSGKQGQPLTSPYALRMIGVLPDGTIVPFNLFENSVALVQFVHNSPDPALSEVDVWMGNVRVADNMKFRDATPMLYLAAEKSNDIVIANKNSTTPASPIIALPIAFEESRAYTLFMSGLIDPTGYKDNPDGRDIAIRFTQRDETHLKSDNDANVQIAFTNLVTDLPHVSFIDRTSGPLQENLGFTEFGAYQSVQPENIIIDVVNPSDETDVHATYFANLETYAGRAGQVFTSGFYDTEANKNSYMMGLFCVFPDGEVIEFPRYIPPEAQFQFTHNSPDPALATMDVYIDGELFIDDMAFRKATPFLDVPADAEVTFDFAPGNSTGPGEALYSTVYSPVNEQSYFMIVQGVVDPNAYDANPNGKNTALNAYIKAGMPLSGVDANKVALNFIPGATDMKAIDLRTHNFGEVFSSAIYGEFAQTTTIAPSSYLSDINYTGDTTDIFNTYLTNYSSFAGRFVTLFTSGFVTPASNNNGPEFGLYGVFPDGRVFRYYEYVAPTAQMQFIHNAPDPDLLELDVYVNDELVADNMLFRTATEFLSIPAGEQITVSIAPFNSTGPEDSTISFSGTYTERSDYLVMLYGVNDPANFQDNPDGANIAFAVDSLSHVPTYASYPDEIELNTFNGVPDIPSIAVIERDGPTLINDLGFGMHTGYSTSKPLLNALYDVTDANDPSVVFGNYQIDLTAYGGKSGVMFLSGFYNPEANMGGQPLGLFMAFPDGNVIEFTHEEPKFAQIQIINNSADSRAEAVDIYINGEKVADDLHYLNATPYIEVRAEEDLIIAVGKMESNTPTKPLYEQMYSLPEGSVNFAMINGVTEPAMFATNPDQISIGMTIAHHPDVRLQAQNPSLADFIFVNGITDLPALNLIIKDGNPVFENVAFNQITDYMTLEIEPYIFDLVLANDPDSIIARFDGDIVDLKGLATLVFTSGFFSPGDNENGPELTMQAAFPNGSVIPFDKIALVSVDRLPMAGAWDMSLAPNPAVSGTLIRYTLDRMTPVQFTVYDQLGRIRLEHNAGTNAPGIHAYPMNLAGMEPGTYIVVMQTQYGIATRKVAVVK